MATEGNELSYSLAAFFAFFLSAFIFFNYSSFSFSLSDISLPMISISLILCATGSGLGSLS